MFILFYVNLIILFISFTIIFYYAKFRFFLKLFFLGAISGILMLGLINFVFPGFLNLNFFTIIMAVIAGAPGIILEVLIKNFFIM